MWLIFHKQSINLCFSLQTLLLLLMVKTPITEADSIRALACQALCGLSRSETVQQILSKLPLFANNQLQGMFIYYHKRLTCFDGI